MAHWAGGLSPSGRGPNATAAQLEEVLKAVRRTPIIDNHAHPLLKPESLGRYPLLSITTEASGDAIHDAAKSLAHLRAIRQLAATLGCALTWEAVVGAIEQRRITSMDDWVAQCLGGVEMVMVDDGLDSEDDVYDYSWHDSFTRSPCKRIVRLESVATEIIRRHAAAAIDGADERFSHNGIVDVFDQVLKEFDAEIAEAVADPEVVGFKSVICYRTGLDIAREADVAAAKSSFEAILADYQASGTFSRLQHDGLNDLFVHRTATLICESERQKKPLQFHTGLGDNDITLTKASPAHLQEFIRAYPSLPIVLLHASYPFTRDAGYLAAVYPNVYADIGEVFPFISKDGQEAVLRQILELCPWSKILWSTDGHWFPETYLLAIVQIREVLGSVLCDYVRKGQLGWRAAVELVKAVLYVNSNKLYHLHLPFTELDGDEASGSEAFTPDFELFQAFLGQGTHSRPDFIRICWNDLTAMPRMRMVPFRRFMTLLQDGKSVDIGITKACLGMLQNDLVVPGVSATGEYRLHPDFSSLRHGPISGHVSMHGEFRHQDGSMVELCPRSLLQKAVASAAAEGLRFLIGFEIEFLLMERLGRGQGPVSYGTLATDGHAWSTSRYFADSRIATLLSDMVSELDSMGIFVEQIHAESATGQFELILPPLGPVEAVDTLLHARDVMSALASAAGYRMTLHPKPFAAACGTASHVHISIPSRSGARSEVQTYESFYAGILKHLRGIMAFTYSNPASYERMADGCWAGGRWVAWGTQNRETALRKIDGSHWELKVLDGLANPYLALGAVLLAGTNGVREQESLVWRDCEVDPARLTENDKRELGIAHMLPASTEEALKALQEDAELVELIGPELVERYSMVKEVELNMLGEMAEEERRQWIMERY